MRWLRNLLCRHVWSAQIPDITLEDGWTVRLTECLNCPKKIWWYQSGTMTFTAKKT